MSTSIFAVASIGCEERDQNILITTMELAKSRTPSFALFEDMPDRKTADILVVNADNPDAIKRWKAYLKLHGAKQKISSIMLCESVPPDNPNDPNRYFEKPLVATRLLSILEELAILEHDYSVPSIFSGNAEEVELDNVVDSEITNSRISALVVDDSLPVRIQMKKALQHIASKSDFAETGEEARELLKKNKYDIVFLDVILPGVDGYDLCKEIKQDPDKSDIPVIMLTSNSSPADRVKGKLAGCDTYLIKPVNPEIFKEVVYEYLDLETDS